MNPEVLAIAEQAILEMSKNGTHIKNAYHNVEHCQQVLEACKKILEYDEQPLTIEIVWAALFHDYNHSGGIKDDRYNILKAMDGFEYHLDNPNELYELIADQIGKVKFDEVMELILCTKYVDNNFVYEPETYYQQVIRDADLMAVYLPHEEAANVLLGLYEELQYKLSNLTRKGFIKKNREFLMNAKWYTAYGNHLKETKLEQELLEIEQYL